MSRNRASAKKAGSSFERLCVLCGKTQILKHPPTSDRCASCVALIASRAATAKALTVPTWDRMEPRISVSPFGCWLWPGSLNKRGYGYVFHEGRQREAHRVAYTLLVGPIPDGLQIDHLCHTRNCINPEHLEAVTPRVNTLRGKSPSAINAKRTECANGHPFDENNTWWRVEKNGRTKRYCRECRRRRVREFQQRGKAA